MSIASYLLERSTGGSWVTISAGSVLDVSGNWATATGENSGVAFGDDTDTSMSAELLLSEWANLPYMTPIRYTTTMDADITRTFVGVVTKRRRDMVKMRIEATGMKALISATKGYSPAIERRPVATKTTAISADDITNPGWSSGLINWLLWTAGGQP